MQGELQATQGDFTWDEMRFHPCKVNLHEAMSHQCDHSLLDIVFQCSVWPHMGWISPHIKSSFMSHIEKIP